MYKLDVSKTPLDDYVVSVSKEGSCIEDHIAIKDDGVNFLVAECSNLLKHGLSGPTMNQSNIALDKHGNVYQLVVHVSPSFVKSYVLTETEIKLFQASLKRAVDG